MINVSQLSDVQKAKLQRVLEINKPMTYGMLAVALGYAVRP